MKNASSQPAPKSQVGVWIRVSTEDQAKGDSPEHHLLRARHYAAAKNWEVKEVYDLAGFSGKSVMEHPETVRMLADVRRGHITGLIFSKLARLARNAPELMEISEIFREHEVHLISLHENFDTSTPSGRHFFNMTAVNAQWEREEIVDRVNASVAIRAKLGLPLGGKGAFGYTWKDKKLVPHPDEAPVRKLIYELFAEHRRKKAVARILNERGFRTRNGSKWSDTTIHRLIQDPTAKGIHRMNYTKHTGQGRAWALKPEHDWAIHQVPAIVPVELWERCNALLDARKGSRPRIGRRPVHLFAGLAFCACGQKMYVPSTTPKYTCRKCRNKIPAEDLEAVFLDELKGYLLSPDRVAEYVAKANTARDQKCQLIDTLRKELTRVTSEIEKLFRLYNEDGLTSAQFKARHQPLDERKTQIMAEIPVAEADICLLKADAFSTEYIMEESRNIFACWPAMSQDERRRMVENLVKHITIATDEIDITFCYLPSFEETANRQHILRGSSRRRA